MEVIQSTQCDHEEQFDRLVTAYQTALLRMCYVYLKDHALAQDAVQETYLKAYKSLSRFRGECSEKTWLMHIAVNTCRDMLRSGWNRHVDRRVTPELLEQRAESPSTADRELMMELMELPNKLKEVLLLYYYQGMTVAETAKALGVSQATISNRLGQARHKLRDALQGGDGYDRA